jgi:hypothetical protein
MEERTCRYYIVEDLLMMILQEEDSRDEIEGHGNEGEKKPRRKLSALHSHVNDVYQLQTSNIHRSFS